jgi:hypothetical protein
MQRPYVLLLKLYGRSELAAFLHDGDWIGSFRICLKIFDEWKLKKKRGMLCSFVEEVISLTLWCCKHGIMPRHSLCIAGKVKGKARERSFGTRLSLRTGYVNN